MISTDITRTAIDCTTDRYRAPGTSGRAAVCPTMPTTPTTRTVPTVQDTSAVTRITAELRVSSFAGGHVWLRPAALDATVPATPGHLAWSPPT